MSSKWNVKALMKTKLRNKCSLGGQIAYLKVPRSTSWPDSLIWVPSFNSEPKAMYSPKAQSTTRFRTISARAFRIRLKPETSLVLCNHLSGKMFEIMNF